MSTSSGPAGRTAAAAIHDKLYAWRALLGRGYWRAIIGAVAALLGALVLSAVDITPSLEHVHTGLFTGPGAGQYHALGTRLAARAARDGGAVRLVQTAGSQDNLDRLAAQGATCDTPFAPVQDGVPWATSEGAPIAELTLLGAFGHGEALLILVDPTRAGTPLSAMKGARVGVGAPSSGTAHLMRALLALPTLAPLGITLVHGDAAAQRAAVKAGTLDGAAMVVDVHAPAITAAIRASGLAPLALPQAEALATRLPGVDAGVIPRGHIDPVADQPREDVPVLHVRTLLVAHTCAPRDQVMGMLQLFAHGTPGFFAQNRAAVDHEDRQLSSSARSFFTNGGPDLLDKHAPWLANIVPLSAFVTLIMAISVLFNVMNAAHRFRLWRLDAARFKLTQRAEAADWKDEGTRAGLIAEFRVLRHTCRRHAVSVLVPMGQEMSYRYQESLIDQVLDRLLAAHDDASQPET